LSLRQLWDFPFADGKWSGKTLLGGLLLLFWPLLLPLLLALGYLVALTRLYALPTSNVLPAWRPWGQRLGEGARLLAAILLYGWPVSLALSTLVVGPLVINGPLTGSAAAGYLVGLAVTLQPIGLAWTLVAVLLFPLHLRQVAAAQTWRQALSPARLLGLLRASRRALPMLWTKELLLLLRSLSGLLIALVGFPFLLFWALLGVARLAATLRDTNAASLSD
jgi:hypothetical protein